MNKVHTHRYNEKYNIIQRYKINNFKPANFIVLGYDIADTTGKLIKSFVTFDQAVEWIEANHDH